MMAVDELIARIVARKGTILRGMWIPQLLIGAFLVFIAYGIGHAHFHLIREGVRAPGRVVGHQQKSFARSGSSRWYTTTALMPIVEFDAGGSVVRFEDWLGSSSTGGLPDRVTVLYDPANPSVAMIDRAVMNWIPWAPIGGVGLFLVLVAIEARVRPR